MKAVFERLGKVELFLPVMARYTGSTDIAPSCEFSEKETVAQVLERVRGGTEAGGECALYPAVQAAYRILMTEAAANIPQYPGEKYEGRGIVMAGGGIYFDPLFVSIKLLRSVGCTLPIEVWHLGSAEMLDWQKKLLTELGVTTVDAYAAVENQRPRGGWELKPFAVLNTQFEEVLYLDADAYAAKNPTYLFDSPEYKKYGSIFWADQDQYETKDVAFEAIGIDKGNSRPIESGQFIVNKKECWRELWLTNWMNTHSPYYYRLYYGDKESYRFCWLYLGEHDLCYPPLAYVVERPAMLGHDFDGSVIFVHRCCGKITLAPHNVFTKNTSESFRNDALPLEDEAWKYLEQLREKRKGLLPLPPLRGDCGCNRKK